jgi:hypothetical protein
MIIIQTTKNHQIIKYEVIFSHFVVQVNAPQYFLKILIFDLI